MTLNAKYNKNEVDASKKHLQNVWTAIWLKQDNHIKLTLKIIQVNQLNY